LAPPLIESHSVSEEVTTAEIEIALDPYR